MYSVLLYCFCLVSDYLKAREDMDKIRNEQDELRKSKDVNKTRTHAHTQKNSIKTSGNGFLYLSTLMTSGVYH